MISQVILLLAGPDDYHSGYAALAAAERELAAGNHIQQVFFYGPAVLYASVHLSFPNGIDNLQQRWQALAAEHNIELVVCATVAVEYGVVPEASPAGALAAGFVAGGLTEWVTCLAKAQQLLQFPANGGSAPQGPHTSEWLFMISADAGTAKARHGLDMLMLAVSFDIPCKAVYAASALGQLQTPTTPYDPLKKMNMLPDIFDFNDFYVACEHVDLLPAHTQRVPVRWLTATELTQIRQQARHIIHF